MTEAYLRQVCEAHDRDVKRVERELREATARVWKAL